MTSTYGAPSDMIYTNTLRAEEYRRTVEHIDIFNGDANAQLVTVYFGTIQLIQQTIPAGWNVQYTTNGGWSTPAGASMNFYFPGGW